MMNLAEKINIVKQKIKPAENDLILVMVIVFVALISFGLGRLSAVYEKKTPINVDSSNMIGVKDLSGNVSQTVNKEGDSSTEKLYVASKSGTKYHYPWCAGAQNIKEENKIWFSSKEEAEKAGYDPAGNCKGL